MKSQNVKKKNLEIFHYENRTSRSKAPVLVIVFQEKFFFSSFAEEPGVLQFCFILVWFGFICFLINTNI